MSAAPGPDARARARLYQLAAALVTAGLIVAVLLAVFTGSGSPRLVPGKPVPGAAKTLALFAGIPQRGLLLGAPGAPVTLVEFGDLQCPACATFAHKALPAIVSGYVRPGQVKLLFRPLAFIGPDSRRAAQMAVALGQQSRLWQFADLMYRNQGLENSSYVSDTYLRALAAAIPGVEVSRALAARESAAVQAQLAEAKALAARRRVRETPSFLLSLTGTPGQPFSPQSFDSASFTGPLEKLLAGG